jgi:hypothetical protein
MCDTREVKETAGLVLTCPEPGLGGAPHEVAVEEIKVEESHARRQFKSFALRP